ncbi:MAG: hypothetical protein JWR77_2576 [Rhizorhabdus sp.]|nr:hypothetical protein [Rhizorhabdus sp.]
MTETFTSRCGDVRIVAPVVIQEVLTERTCRAALPNGKLIFGFIEQPGLVLEQGISAKAILSLCDFSRGEIIPGEKKPV